MGTSTSGSGGGGSNPLIPTWIDGGGGFPPPSPQPPPQPPPDGQGNPPPTPNDNTTQPQQNPNQTATNTQPQNNNQVVSASGGGTSGNRYTGPRRQFNKYARSGGTDTRSLKQALKGYSRTAAGSTSGLAKRMRPATSRVAVFYDTIDTIRRRGVTQALSEFNLTAYTSRPLLDTLSALSDVIFADTGKIYENTQDDNITRAAYSNTVMRICENNPDMDLNVLTNEQVEVMMSVFIEETIAQRIINDIGNQFTKSVNDINALVEIENNVYQVVSGLVRNQISTEITATRLGNREDLTRNIENIYRVAFDALAAIND